MHEERGDPCTFITGNGAWEDTLRGLAGQAPATGISAGFSIRGFDSPVPGNKSTPLWTTGRTPDPIQGQKT